MSHKFKFPQIKFTQRQTNYLTLIIKNLLIVAGFIFSQNSAWGQHQSDGKPLADATGKYPQWLSKESIQKSVNSNTVRAPFRSSAPQTSDLENYKAQAWTITVDTSDQQNCKKVYHAVSRFHHVGPQSYSAEEVCRYDAKNPAVTFFVFQDQEQAYFITEVNDKFFKSTEKSIITDTRNLSLVMLATMGVLWMMPESTTGWNHEEIRNSNGIFGLYKENIRAGPVMDKDDGKFNYIGHPIAGAAYYMMARHSGLSAMQSFGYSVAMSTFFWEYGFEAIAEIPSIQDLIITPVVGSLLGHLLYNVEKKLDAQNGEIFRSKKIGNFVKVIINPMGTLSDGINKMLSYRFIQNSRSEIYVRGATKDPFGYSNSGAIGFRSIFVF